MSAYVITKPCPDCGAVGSLTLTVRHVARRPGTFSLAGAQLKLSTREVAVLACAACGRSRMGRVEGMDVHPSGVISGGHFVHDPTVEDEVVIS